MGKKVLHQFLMDVSRGDATSDHAFLIRSWLREFGFDSEIYGAVYDTQHLSVTIHPATITLNFAKIRIIWWIFLTIFREKACYVRTDFFIFALYVM